MQALRQRKFAAVEALLQPVPVVVDRKPDQPEPRDPKRHLLEHVHVCLVDTFDPVASEPKGSTVLDLVVQYGDEEVLRWLLEYRQGFCYTPPHLAHPLPPQVKPTAIKVRATHWPRHAGVAWSRRVLGVVLLLLAGAAVT